MKACFQLVKECVSAWIAVNFTAKGHAEFYCAKFKSVKFDKHTLEVYMWPQNFTYIQYTLKLYTPVSQDCKYALIYLFLLIADVLSE